MNTLKRSIQQLRNAGFMFIVYFALVACSDQEEILNETEVAEPAKEIVSTVSEEEVEVASFTISGLHTNIVGEVDCASCTYSVPDDVKQVDGAELGIKAGSVICISKGRRLGEIEFVNLIGTASDPISIAICAE